MWRFSGRFPTVVYACRALCRCVRGPGVGQEGRRGASPHHKPTLVLVLLALVLLAVSGARAATTAINITFPKDTLYLINSDSESKKADVIQAAVKGANERLDQFKIERSADIITLSFSMFTGGSKADFRLVGEKMDFYRMAMGVGLDEILTKLTEADPFVRAGGTSKADKSIVLTVLYEPEAKPEQPKPEQPKVQAPPPASQAMFKPKPKPAYEVPSQISQQKKQEQEALEALEEQENIAYIEALESGDPAKFIEFADKFPKSARADKARAMAEKKKEDAAFKKAVADNTKKSFEDFIAAYPRSAKVAEAKNKIAEVEAAEKAQAEELERKKAEELAASEEKKQLEEYEQVRRTQSPDELEKFAAKNPKHPRAKEAMSLARDIREDKLFAAAKETPEGLEKFLADYPKGKNAQAAAQLLDKLKNTQGQKIVAVSAPVAPNVDGVGSDPAWAKAKPVTVGLAGRGPIGSVEVRAVHNGGRIYFLASWRDKTQNVNYRPYLWDKAKGKHVPSDELDDAFSIALYMGNPPSDSCMLNGEEQKVDIWLWRAFWSDISGLASDQSIVTSRERLRKATPRVSPNGGQIWVRNLPDEGEPGWLYVVPGADWPPSDHPAYKASKGTGSAADVAAKGKWANGVWTVEFSRALNPQHEDDAAIPQDGQIVVSFAAYDKSEKDNHTASQICRLQIQR